ncbi:hypothetical protein O0I10_011058 [Lichtheimia ornata]|uniref:Uncharacterized protein n=1 Tax=Lichtheimia ornata TaxID=688661 RepID=A0AAD7UUD0_9FUNG|nr:uncharacterized protein O0I10_011058 [Lichtheimia ornata]KAJ8653308.1 hypothetical protein O0I10_011058 [Lichtheimia ornata]
MAAFQKTRGRIGQSKYTKLYITLALLQGITIIALQSTIVAENHAQTLNIAFSFPSSDQQNKDADVIINDAVNRWIEIKWENIAVIAFQIWFVGMAFDAIVYQNAAEIIALAILNSICGFLSIIPITEAQRWADVFDRLYIDYSVIIDVSPSQTAFYAEIAHTAIFILCSLTFNYISYLVVKEFGWTIYKKIGPIVAIQKMYQIFQFFVLTLKIDIFLEFFISCFHIARFAAAGAGLQWDGYIEIAVTFLTLPALYLGRMTASSEHYGRMLLFIGFQLAVIFSLVLMLWRTVLRHSAWHMWFAFVIMAIVFAVATVVLGAWTMSNFGKGLGPYVRRGTQKKEQISRDELLERRSVSSWRIDDD